MNTITDLKSLPHTENLMPVLFVGHGNPMYGIEENEFTRGWREMVEDVPKPEAVVVVSAHWETRGTKVTAMPKPRVIYDFYGFPKELFEARYDAPGSPEIAAEIAENFRRTMVELDETEWGLDHGSWTILRRMFPDADVPVLQVSLDYTRPAKEHFELAKDLEFLRQRGVLVIGSGNMVHNLRLINFRAPRSGADWAVEANETLKKLIAAGEFEKIADYGSLGREVALAVPTPEHFLPMLYTLALKKEGEPVRLYNDQLDLGSISMTSVRVG